MKLIKKIAAIMFAFMMVFSLSTNAKAEGTKGTIKITNAINGQDYSIYKIMDLESYDKNKGLYSYKPANSEWENFFKTNEVAKKYIYLNSDNGITWKTKKEEGESDDAYKARLEPQAAELAKAALTFAKGNITATATATKNKDNAISFDNLDLGYYLVDSSVGALCGLTTTNTEVSIQDKNEVPTLSKTVKNVAHTDAAGEYANGSIGDEFEFKINFTVKKGVENYVVHDKMSKALTLNQGSFQITVNKNGISNRNYNLKTSGTGDDCTFDIEFYSGSLNVNDEVEISYKAKLNKDPDIGFSGQFTENKNTAWLAYGDGKKSDDANTNVYTYQIPVLKYTNTITGKQGLSDAKFTLSTDEQGKNKISFVKMPSENGYDVYRKAEEGEQNTVTVITTNTNGKFKFVGVNQKYYLTETEAPKGYNKLKDSIEIQASEMNMVLVNGTMINTENVEVVNNSGSLLPSTGGMGTTLIYLVGGALVLGSGFVLANKKRAKAK